MMLAPFRGAFRRFLAPSTTSPFLGKYLSAVFLAIETGLSREGRGKSLGA